MGAHLRLARKRRREGEITESETGSRGRSLRRESENETEGEMKNRGRLAVDAGL
jgi:hypothetical protein